MDLDQLRDSTVLQGAGGAGAWADKALYDEYKEAAQALRKLIDSARGSAVFDPETALPAADAGLRLARLARAVAETYEKKKLALDVLDFVDLLTHTRTLLAGSAHAALRRQLAGQTRLLLVDEFPGHRSRAGRTGQAALRFGRHLGQGSSSWEISNNPSTVSAARNPKCFTNCKASCRRPGSCR